MDEDFRIEFFKLIEHLLKAENLVSKKINDIELDGSIFLNYTIQYLKLFQSEQLPKTQSIYESTVEKQLDILITSCTESYMKAIRSRDDSIEKLEEIPLIHEASRNEVLLMYKDSKKMGNAEHEAHFRKMLEDQINKTYKEWKEQTEANIRKVENEKKKTRVALEEKQKLALENLEHEKQALKHTFELEKMKQEFALEILTFTKDKEIDKVKYEAEQKRLADERQHDMEKFKLEKEIDREKFSKDIEIEKHILQNEHICKIAEQNVNLEKIKADAEHQIVEQSSKAQYLQLEKALDREKLLLQMEAVEKSNKSGQEHLALTMTMELEKLKTQRENDQQNYLRDQEIKKAEQKVEEQRLMNCLIQQKNDEMSRRLQTAEENISQLNERDDQQILGKVLDIVDSGINLIAGGRRKRIKHPKNHNN